MNETNGWDREKMTVRNRNGWDFPKNTFINIFHVRLSFSKKKKKSDFQNKIENKTYNSNCTSNNLINPYREK